MAAKPGRLSDAELDRYLAEVDERRATARGRLDDLLARLGGVRQATDGLALMEEYLRDLPDLLDRMPPLREYETVPEPRTEENPLGIYTLTPERIRHRSEEELARREQETEAERAARFRWAYELLALKVKVHPDGRLEIAWSPFGPDQRRVVSPGSGPPTRCVAEDWSW